MSWFKRRVEEHLDYRRGVKDFEREERLKRQDRLSSYSEGTTSRANVRHIYSKVYGVTRENEDGSSRQRIILGCSPGEELAIEPEPDNPVDENALKIVRRNGEQIGYVKAELASELRHKLRDGWVISTYAKNITGGRERDESLGLNIVFILAEPGSTLKEINRYYRSIRYDD